MDIIAFFIGNYLGNLPVALLMACLAKAWSKDVSWKRLLGYGAYFNLLPSSVEALKLILSRLT